MIFNIFFKIVLTFVLVCQFYFALPMKRKNIEQSENSSKNQKIYLNCPFKGQLRKQMTEKKDRRCSNNAKMGFASQEKINDHIIYFHNVCPWCDFGLKDGLSNLNELAAHMKEVHNELSLVCSICNDFIVSTRKERSYQNHVKKCINKNNNNNIQRRILPRILPNNNNNNNAGVRIQISNADVPQQFFNTTIYNNYTIHISQPPQIDSQVLYQMVTQALQNQYFQSQQEYQQQPQQNLQPSFNCSICDNFVTSNQDDLKIHEVECFQSNLIFEVVNLDSESLESEHNQNCIVHQDNQLNVIDQIGNEGCPLDPLFGEETNQDSYDDATTRNIPTNNNNGEIASNQKQNGAHKRKKVKRASRKKENNEIDEPNQRYDCFLVDKNNCTNNKQRGYGRQNLLKDHLVRDHKTCPWSKECGITDQFESAKELHLHINSYGHPYKSCYCEACDYISIDKTGNFRRHKESKKCIEKNSNG